VYIYFPCGWRCGIYVRVNMESLTLCTYRLKISSIHNQLSFFILVCIV
jgi:hypothetical protein